MDPPLQLARPVGHPHCGAQGMALEVADPKWSLGSQSPRSSRATAAYFASSRIFSNLRSNQRQRPVWWRRCGSGSSELEDHDHQYDDHQNTDDRSDQTSVHDLLLKELVPTGVETTGFMLSRFTSYGDRATPPTSPETQALKLGASKPAAATVRPNGACYPHSVPGLPRTTAASMAS